MPGEQSRYFNDLIHCYLSRLVEREYSISMNRHSFEFN